MQSRLPEVSPPVVAICGSRDGLNSRRTTANVPQETCKYALAAGPPQRSAPRGAASAGKRQYFGPGGVVVEVSFHLNADISRHQSLKV